MCPACPRGTPALPLCLGKAENSASSPPFTCLKCQSLCGRRDSPGPSSTRLHRGGSWLQEPGLAEAAKKKASEELRVEVTPLPSPQRLCFTSQHLGLIFPCLKDSLFPGQTTSPTPLTALKPHDKGTGTRGRQFQDWTGERYIRDDQSQAFVL